MSSDWRPDDSLYERGKDGVINGARRVREALQKHGVRFGNRIITSRDEGMDAAQQELKRTPMPPGVEQWQVPIVVGAGQDVLWFRSRMQPGAKVPEHAHKTGLLRIVIEGSVKVGDVELKPGDWMFVPAGKTYSLEAGPDGCIVMYPHFPFPWPWWPW